MVWESQNQNWKMQKDCKLKIAKCKLQIAAPILLSVASVRSLRLCVELF